MSSIEIGDQIFVGPIRDQEKNMYDNLIHINKEHKNHIAHFPQILETGEVTDLFEDDTCLVNFGTYKFVLPLEAISLFDDEASYYELLDELELLVYNLGAKIVYIRPPSYENPEDFKDEIKKGLGFNHPEILAFTKKTVHELLTFYIDTSDIQSLEINGKNITIGMVKILWNYMKYKENNPSSYKADTIS